MKVIDFETLFEKKLEQYMREKKGKYTEEEWEALIPKLYRNYGDIFIPAAGATPREYFAHMSDGELLDSLQAYLREKIPVPDFLLRELERRDCPNALIDAAQDAEEDLALALLSAAGDSDRAMELAFSLLTEDVSDAVKEAAAEKLKSGSFAPFTERAIERYLEKKGGDFLLELLCSGDSRDDRILRILVEELESARERLPFLANLIARYNDERALDALLKRIDREETTFVEYRELLCAIEALGGHYDKERDFSSDRDYVLVKENSQKEVE